MELDMDLSEIQPIPNESALFIKNKQILVVADLHIGIESQLREQGLHVSSQAQKMIDHLLSICKKYKPKEII
jgi:metallophosphoesterase superfamily enzyme